MRAAAARTDDAGRLQPSQIDGAVAVEIPLLEELLHQRLLVALERILRHLRSRIRRVLLIDLRFLVARTSHLAAGVDGDDVAAQGGGEASSAHGN